MKHLLQKYAFIWLYASQIFHIISIYRCYILTLEDSSRANSALVRIRIARVKYYLEGHSSSRTRKSADLGGHSSSRTWYYHAMMIQSKVKQTTETPWTVDAWFQLSSQSCINWRFIHLKFFVQGFTRAFAQSVRKTNCNIQRIFFNFSHIRHYMRELKIQT